jgi:hypothetical protein
LLKLLRFTLQSASRIVLQSRRALVATGIWIC